MRRRVTPGVCVTFLMLASVVPAARAADSIHYVGQVDTQPGSSVAVTLHDHRRVTFRASNISMECEDGQARVWDRLTATIRWRAQNRSDYGIFKELRTERNRWSYIRGTTLRPYASGYLYFENAMRGQPVDEPHCWTSGALAWSADRQ
jgi:hypothetical protein